MNFQHFFCRTTQSVDDLDLIFKNIEKEIGIKVSSSGAAKSKKHIDALLFSKV
jgi:hypothetical protein